MSLATSWTALVPAARASQLRSSMRCTRFPPPASHRRCRSREATMSGFVGFCRDAPTDVSSFASRRRAVDEQAARCNAWGEQRPTHTTHGAIAWGDRYCALGVLKVGPISTELGPPRQTKCGPAGAAERAYSCNGNRAPPIRPPLAVTISRSRRARGSNQFKAELVAKWGLRVRIWTNIGPVCMGLRNRSRHGTLKPPRRRTSATSGSSFVSRHREHLKDSSAMTSSVPVSGERGVLPHGL